MWTFRPIWSCARSGMIAALGLILVTAPAGAQGRSELVTTEGAWSLFRLVGGEQERCWISTAATTGSDNLELESIIAMFDVRTRQFSVFYDGLVFPRTTGTLLVGANRYPMLFGGDQGWVNGAFRDEVAYDLSANGVSAVSLEGSGFAFSNAGFRELVAGADTHCAPKAETD